MKKHLFFVLAIFATASLFFTACSKDEEKDPPTLNFKTETGYTSADATVNFGDTINVGLLAESNGSDNITKLLVTANDQVMLDSTLNVLQLVVDFNIIKSASGSETWKFSITDAASKKTEKVILLSRASTEITVYNDIILGAQDNTTEPQFLATTDGSRYSQDEAFNNQAIIDIFCFYENTASHQNFTTLASPGSNITEIYFGSTAPDFYTTKNVTFFCKTTLTVAQFDEVTNDEVILQSFDPENQYKKAKNLQVGEVYAFLTQAGKYGLYKVTAVTPETTGSMGMSVKIQK